MIDGYQGEVCLSHHVALSYIAWVKKIEFNSFEFSAIHSSLRIYDSLPCGNCKNNSDPRSVIRRFDLEREAKISMGYEDKIFCRFFEPAREPLC